MASKLLLAVVSGAAVFLSSATAGNSKTSKCRSFPGDRSWPSPAEWNQFNKTIGGKLVATIPIASVCHDSSFGTYDADKCTQLQSAWHIPDTHWETSSSVQSAFYANQICDPFTDRSARCALGSYVQYAVDARTAHDYQKTLAFVRDKNIRLVVRNTGHDFHGKSTGAGALALWTHNIKSIRIDDYKSKYYKGKAMTLGAGVQVFEANKAAHAQGLVVVGGNCDTVGLAGGYTQGGGHSPLSSKFGLAADQVLEWDVVTAKGKRVTASPTGKHSDLYWALSGGGGGTYAAVLAVTVKAHPDFEVAAANLTFSGDGVDDVAFRRVLQTFLTTIPAVADAGGVASWLMVGKLFILPNLLAPGMSVETLRGLLQPIFDSLDGSGIAYASFVGGFPNYLDAYRKVIPVAAVTEFNLGGRLFPRSLMQPSSIPKIVDTLLSLSAEGAVSGISLNVTGGAEHGVQNSAHPAWRGASTSIVAGIPYNRLDLNANVLARQRVTQELMPQLTALTPGTSASYLNEADPNEPKFQDVFYGQNYQRLREIKKKYDPEEIFYGLTAVGSENWKEREDGRLCRVA